VNLRNARFAADQAPIERDCRCYTCRTFSLAYLRHLFIAGETLGLKLATLHNLHFMLETMRRIRQAILEGNFIAYKERFLADYQTVAEEKRQRRGKQEPQEAAGKWSKPKGG
jgi:queuine tRNA-ribosyltransferase